MPSFLLRNGRTFCCWVVPVVPCSLGFARYRRVQFHVVDQSTLVGAARGQRMAAGRLAILGSNFDFWAEWNYMELHGTTELRYFIPLSDNLGSGLVI
jgi:hypothetical protein